MVIKLLLFAIVSMTSILAKSIGRELGGRSQVSTCESALVPGLTAKVVMSSDGTPIYGEAVGDPSKPHLIFVHGFALSASVFNRIFYNPEYQERFYLVRYDTRGHGRSGQPTTVDKYASRFYADDFVAITKEFNVTRPVFVGWSLGGSVAADIVANLPKDTLSGIVYLSALVALSLNDVVLVKSSAPTITTLQNGTALPEDARLATLNFTDDVFEQLSILETASEEVLVARRLRRWEVQNTWIGYAEHQSVQARSFVVVRQQDNGPLFELGKTNFPVLLIHGTQDALIGTQVAITIARGLFNNLKVVVIEKGGSHAAFHWHPTEVMQNIGDFAHEVYKRHS